MMIPLSQLSTGDARKLLESKILEYERESLNLQILQKSYEAIIGTKFMTDKFLEKFQSVNADLELNSKLLESATELLSSLKDE